MLNGLESVSAQLDDKIILAERRYRAAVLVLFNVELSGRPLAAGPLQRRVGRLVDRETPEIGLRHSAK